MATFTDSIKVAVNGIQLGNHIRVSHFQSDLRVQLVDFERPVGNPLVKWDGGLVLKSSFCIFIFHELLPSQTYFVYSQLRCRDANVLESLSHLCY